jgi:hypothetical protein
MSPAIAAGLYFVLLWLVLRTTRRRRRTYLAAAGVAVSMAVAGGVGGWPMVGTALAIWAAVQITPAVWSAFRIRGPLAIAPGLWMVGFGQALLWGYYGYAVRDMALVLYGIAMGAGSAAILLRFATGPQRSTRLVRRFEEQAPQRNEAVLTPWPQVIS